MAPTAYSSPSRVTQTSSRKNLPLLKLLVDTIFPYIYGTFDNSQKLFYKWHIHTEIL